MRQRIAALFVLVVVAVGVAAGARLAGDLSDGRTAAQEHAETPTVPAGAVVVGEPPEPPAGTVTPVPTCPPEPPTPTPIPGEQSTYWPVTPAPQPCIPVDQPAPDKTPDLSSLFQREREPEECEGCIDLGKPVPYEVPMGVGGKEIHLPVGSTHHMMFVDYPAGTGLLGPRQLEIIERGDSKVVIATHTGEIIEWNVAPEDEADFRRLILEPLQPLQ